MCCIVALGGLIGPRVALIFAWIFTNEVSQAFSSFWLPFLGLIFFPWTTLMYAIAYAPIVGVSGFWGYLLVALGIALDIGSYSASAYQRGMRQGGGATGTYA
jgi:hypothetical protein